MNHVFELFKNLKPKKKKHEEIVWNFYIVCEEIAT